MLSLKQLFVIFLTSVIAGCIITVAVTGIFPTSVQFIRMGAGIGILALIVVAAVKA